MIKCIMNHETHKQTGGEGRKSLLVNYQADGNINRNGAWCMIPLLSRIYSKLGNSWGQNLHQPPF